MIDVAKHLRIFEPEADDNFVDKRTKAINALVAEFKKRKYIEDKIVLADDFGNLLDDFASNPHGISDTIASAIKKHSTSFVAEGSELEIVTCGLLALAQWIENGGDAEVLAMADTISISLWSCLSFRPAIDREPKLELLRKELITIAQRRIQEASINTRKRAEIKPLTSIAVPEDGTIGTLVSSLNSAHLKAVNDLRKNAILDREEIECLWWVLSEWSVILNCSLNKLTHSQRAIISGIEFSNHLRRVPNTSHRNLLLRYLSDDSVLDGSELITHLGEKIEQIKAHISKLEIVSKAPSAFPLFHIIVSGNTSIAGSHIKRSLSEWTLRALIEGSIIQLYTIVNDAK